MAGWRTALRVGETIAASGTVIGSRIGTITAAAQAPHTADSRELTTMVTEKLDAFTRSGASLTRDIQAMQAEIVGGLADAAALAMRGALPSARQFAAASKRAARIAEHVAGAADRALMPVHASATANARRLGGKRPD